MAIKKSTTPDREIETMKVDTGGFDAYLVGMSPFVCNRMSEKAQRELLMPRKKSALERELNLKHVPLDEFRASPYLLRDPTQPTLIAMLSSAFHKAIASAALDIPGAKKAQIGRLTWIDGDKTNIYGVPKLWMATVRSADMNHTPDIRTRAIIPEWACRLHITFVEPLIRVQAVANLLAAAGLFIGVGDGRPEKGAMTYGQWRVADKDDADFKRIVKEGGRKAQQAALDHAVAYDDETLDLLTWFSEELVNRQKRGTVSRDATTRENGNGARGVPPTIPGPRRGGERELVV